MFCFELGYIQNCRADVLSKRRKLSTCVGGVIIKNTEHWPPMIGVFKIFPSPTHHFVYLGYKLYTPVPFCTHFSVKISKINIQNKVENIISKKNRQKKKQNYKKKSKYNLKKKQAKKSRNAKKKHGGCTIL